MLPPARECCNVWLSGALRSGKPLLQQPQQRPAGAAVELLLVERAVAVLDGGLEAFLDQRIVFVLVDGLVLVGVGLTNAFRAQHPAKLLAVERAVVIAIERIEFGRRGLLGLGQIERAVMIGIPLLEHGIGAAGSALSLRRGGGRDQSD